MSTATPICLSIPYHIISHRIISDEQSSIHINTLKMEGLTATFRLNGPGRRPKSSTRRCSVCSREFARTEHLVRHERSHRGEKPFSCHICGMHFTRKELVTRHVGKQHQDLSPAFVEGIIQSPVPGFQWPDPPNVDGPPLFVGEGYEDYTTKFWEGLLPDSLGFPTQTAQLVSNSTFDFFTANTGVEEGRNLEEEPTATSTSAEHVNIGSGLDLGNFATSETDLFIPKKDLFLDFFSNESDDLDSSSFGNFEISFAKRKEMISEMDESTLHSEISLLGRLQLERYIIAFFDSMLPILPFVHIPTWGAEDTAPYVLLAMASSGAIYCKNHLHGDRLHQAARVTTLKQGSSSICGDSVLQALFLIVSYGAWSGKSNMVQDALLLQSMLVEVFRCSQRQRSSPSMDDLSRPSVSWKNWIKAETAVRTRYTVFQFLNMLSWTMDIPPAIVISEINEPLPSSELEWKAAGSQEWLRVYKQQAPRVSLTATLDALLSPDSSWTPPRNTFASLVIIHALLQRIWHLRQDRWNNCNSIEFPILSYALDKLELASMPKAESVLSLHSEGASQAYSLNALVRLARVYLCSDIEHLRLAFSTVDENTPLSSTSDLIDRSPASTRAASTAADALQIVLKFGCRCTSNSGCGSLSYFFSSLQCAFYLRRWLRTLESAPHSGWTEDEKRVVASIEYTMCEIDLPKSIQRQPLSIKVVYTSTIAFEGVGTWGAIQNLSSYIKKYTVEVTE
ncbi:hypothetical protein DL95DRAFT_491532 [Leptodontidium sp. 2 PMI_412]|nr:hypothetical protein DL95DRAFT_491532 [Leptodontidium sp. 2 PMI_412]